MIAKKLGSILKYQHLEYAPFPAITCVGKEMLVEFANRLAGPLLRITIAQAEGQPIAQILPEVFSEDISKKAFDSCVRNEPLTLSEKQIITVSEDKLKVSWFDVSINPLHNDDGNLAGMIIYFSDVSHRLVTAKSIDQREIFLNNMFSQAPIALVCYRSSDFIVDFANEIALEMWGKTIEEVRGKPIYEIFPQVLTDPIINARHNESILRFKKGQSHIQKEVELVFIKNGRPQTGWYNYVHEPYTNSSGEIVGVLAIAIEVTDQVLARRKLELVTDGLPSLVSYINNHEEYELVNKAYETWFKRPRNEVIGKTISEVIGQDAYLAVKAHLEKVLAGEAVSFEKWINYADGKRRFVSANYIPHVDSNDHVLGYIGLVNDHTERKVYELSVSEKDAKLRLIIEGIGIGTFEYDFQADTINWSPELKDLLGLPRDLRIDQDTARSVVHPDDLHKVLQQSNALKANQSGYMSLDYRIIRRDNGSVRWIHSRSRVLFTKVGDKDVPSRIIGFSIDITDRKLAEEELTELYQKLEAKVIERTDELSKVNKLFQERNEELHKAQSVLQQLIDSSIELIFVLDCDLKFLAVNSAFENFVQKSRRDLIGKELEMAIEGVRGSQQIDLLKKACQGESFHLRANPSVTRPNIWFDTHFVPLKINGKVEGVIALSRDITTIIKSQKELENLNRQLQQAQRLAGLGSWEWDISNGTVIWSDEMYHIYGYDEKFAVDFAKATERMSPEDAERSRKRTQEYVQQAIENFKLKGETDFNVPSSEIRIQLPGGEKKLLRNTGKIQLTPDGKLHRFLGVLQDITQIRTAEEKLQELVKELEVKNGELKSFNYVASHDLKEPLRNIRTIIELIRVKGNEDPSKYLTKIERAAERMSQLIESILRLSEVSNADREFSKVDLNKVVELCKSDLEFRIKETDALIVADKLPTILGNESQLNQVFSNLFGNSIKFCKTTPKITVTCAETSGADLKTQFQTANVRGTYWRISISDNGIGFDPQFKQQIFEPFKRLHGRSEYAGTGIGLSIVKKIIEKHNGFIDAFSQPGEGAQFVIWLPV